MCSFLREKIQGINQILELLQTGSRLRALEWMVPGKAVVQSWCLETSTASVQVSPAGSPFLMGPCLCALPSPTVRLSGPLVGQSPCLPD